MYGEETKSHQYPNRNFNQRSGNSHFTFTFGGGGPNFFNFGVNTQNSRFIFYSLPPFSWKKDFFQQNFQQGDYIHPRELDKFVDTEELVVLFASTGSNSCESQLYFWKGISQPTDFCEVCLRFESIWEKLTNKLKSFAKMGKINVHHFRNVYQKLGVKEVPTIVVFIDG